MADRRRSGRAEGPRRMFKAVCADCGEPCEVPFKPDPSRPVYCRECWAKRREAREERERKEW